MKKKNKLVIAISLFSLFLAKAQEKKLLTLDEAENIGIQNSKNLKIDEAKIEEATANLLDAKNRQLPDFKLSSSYLRLGNAKINLKLLPPSVGTGGASPNSALIGQANLSMPLFAGGRIKYGIESAKYLIEASKLNAENDKTAVAYNISKAYNNLFKAAQTIKMLEVSLSSSQKRDISFQKLEDNGIIARNDRLKANLQTSTIELQLLDAHNHYNVANINMDLLLGFPEITEIEVDSKYISELVEDKPFDFYLNKAYQNRKDLQAIAYQKKAAELGTKAAKAENLPTVGLTGGYIAADIPNVLTATNVMNIGIGVQYNLANLWKKNSSLMQSQAKEKQLSITNDMMIDQIKLQINQDYQNSIYAKKKISVYEKAAEQANENYRITKNKFDNGLATITELLDADTAQISANISVINAKADAALAYRKLLQTSGILLSK